MSYIKTHQNWRYISVRKILQFCLLYLMAMMTGTYYYNTYPLNVKYIILLVTGGCILLRYVKISNHTKLALICLIASILMSRMFSGGIGLVALLDFVCPLLLIECAYKVDEENFATRYVKFTVFFATASIVFFCLALVNYNVFSTIMSFISRKYQYANGMTCYESFFYGYLPENWFFNQRNDSIFSESAQYSIMLNAALWILLFASDSLKMNEKSKRRALSIVLVALITCMSTTGYVCALIMFACVLFQKKNDFKNKIYLYAGLIGIGITADYFARGADSLLQKIVLDKMFSTSGALDLTASTGAYRMSTIAACFEVFLQKPFGAGYDVVNSYVNRYSLTGEASAGGGFAKALAVYGIVTITILIVWMLHNSKKNIQGVLPMIAFWFFYIWTSFAQARVAYPLIFVPLYIVSLDRFTVKFDYREGVM